MRLIDTGKDWYKAAHPFVRLSAQIGLRETWIVALHVEEEVRGTGLGAEAVKAVISKRPGNTVYLYALPDHSFEMRKLLRFYRRLGFKLFGFQDISSEAKLMRRLPCR